MPVNLPPLGQLEQVGGVRLGTAAAAIGKPGRDDLVIMAFAPGTSVAGVFTRSSFAAAPVRVARRHLAGGDVRGFVINSGNANAATGTRGEDDAARCCAMTAEPLGCRAEQILPFSTGVIGEFLPLERFARGLPEAVAALAEDGWETAARAIMTTDTAPKAVSARASLGGIPVHVTGIAKGSGMIRPDMATMLAFIATDAAVAAPLLEPLAREVADASFNRITIDGDTSTNDAMMLVATGAAGGRRLESADDEGCPALLHALMTVATELAQRLVRDGEGATRFVTVRVEGGLDAAECRRVAHTIAESPLVKTAMFAGDANWGRFCMAIGRAGVPDLDPAGVSLRLDDVLVAEHGMLAGGYTEAAGTAVMARDEYRVTVELGRGDAAEEVWTTDLSYDYVRINAEYRT